MKSSGVVLNSNLKEKGETGNSDGNANYSGQLDFIAYCFETSY